MAAMKLLALLVIELILFTNAINAINGNNNNNNQLIGDESNSELRCAGACESQYVGTPSSPSSSSSSAVKSDSWFACHRGCRFYSLIELLSTAGQLHAIRTSCDTGECFR